MREVDLNVPLSEADVRTLEVGTPVRITGCIVTARDRAHRFLVEEARADELPFDLAGGIVYHCGPIVRGTAEDGYELIAAGPTTSARMNVYVPGLLSKFGVRAIIGKGGMDAGVTDALRDFGAVYLSAVGGAAQVLARAVETVEQGFKVRDFGVPEGMWVLRVKDFPAVVTMDARSRSLHRQLEDASRRHMADILRRR